jgi:hypothetical protein
MGAGARKYSHLLRIPFLGMFAKLRQVTISFIMSVHPSVHMNSLACTGWIFVKCDSWVFYKNLSRKLKFHCNQTRILGTLHKDQHTCLIIFAHFFLEWEMFQTKVVAKIETHFFLNNPPPPPPPNHALYETMWKNIVEPGRPQMTVWRVRIACWIPKVTHTPRICKICCLSTATVFASPHLNVMLYVHCLSCFICS